MSDGQKHSRYGGSVIKRVIECAGSVTLCGSVPPRPSSAYANEGTAAHTLAEHCLRRGLHPAAFLGKDVPGFPGVKVTTDMSDAVVEYLNVLEHEQAQTQTSVLLIEEDFVLPISTTGEGEVFGRNDAMVYHPETGRLRVFDYKHGQGVAVEVNDNPQLKFYLAGALFAHPEWKIRELVLTIVQPRALDMDDRGAVKDWSWDPAEVFEFIAQVEDAVARAEECGSFSPEGLANGYLKTGDHCRWCDAAPVCPARERQALEAATLDFATVTDVTAAALPDPKEMDVARLAKVVAALDILTAWGSQCAEYLSGLVLSGAAVPGWKAVEKLARAEWADDPAKITAYAEMMFGVPAGELIQPKLTTITDATKVLKAYGAKKDDIDAFKLAFTKKESSGLTVAPESDRRPAVNAAARDFADVQPITA